MKSSYLSTIIAVSIFCLFLSINLNKSFAGDITLQLANGNLLIKGELLKFDGKRYTIQSPELGKATFEAGRFICIEGACPTENSNPFAFHDSNSDFSIYGSNTVGTRLMPWIIRGYAKDKGLYGRETVSKNGQEVRFSLTDEYGETVTNINLYRYGSSTAFPALVKKKAVIGMSDRTIKDSEISDLEKIGITNVKGKHEHVIGIDGIVVITSHKNTVSNLSEEQVAEIFAGKITDWAQVGGRPGRINLYAPDRHSGTMSSFNSLVLKSRKLKISDAAKRITENSELSKLVAKDPRSIGFTGFAYIDKSKPIGFRTKCGLIYKATPFNVQTGNYPLARKLYLYTASNIENRHAVGLLDFAKNSKDMNSVLNIAGFINRKIGQSTFNEHKERVFSSMADSDENFDADLMRRVLTEIGKGKRLSYTARFDTGSTELNADSRQEFPKLINYMQKELPPKSYVIVAGFSDTGGDFRNNTVLSLKRARTVRKLLARSMKGKMSNSQFIARGYGELLPSACNDTQEGKTRNRRVEIWVVNEETGKNIQKNQPLPGPALNKNSLVSQINKVSELEKKEQE